MEKFFLAIGLFFAFNSVILAQEPTKIYLPVITNYEPVQGISVKKGIGIASSQVDDLALLRASWYQNWSPFPIQAYYGIYEQDKRFVPKISYSSMMDSLAGDDPPAIFFARGSGWLAGFNEPDRAEQANLTPTQAAILWNEIELKTPPEVGLISPQVSSADPGWLWRFVDKYEALYGVKPRFDVVGYNVYSDDAGQIEAYLTARHDEAIARGYNGKIWLMELGGNCWEIPNGSGQLMDELVPWLETMDWIGRYAWFANRIDGFCEFGVCWTGCTLIDGSGALTGIGAKWRLLP